MIPGWSHAGNCGGGEASDSMAKFSGVGNTQLQSMWDAFLLSLKAWPCLKCQMCIEPSQADGLVIGMLPHVCRNRLPGRTNHMICILHIERNRNVVVVACAALAGASANSFARRPQ